MMRSLTLSTAVVFTVTAFSMALAPAAGAVPSAPGSAGQRPPGGKHCVVHLAPGSHSVAPSGQRLVLLSVQNRTCYRTFTEAIADATGGRITDAPREAATAMADPEFDRRMNALGQTNDQATMQGSWVPLSLEFEHGNYGGDSTAIHISYPACTPKHDVLTLLNLDGSDKFGRWNDKISSFRSYGDCEVNHYEHFDFGGDSTGWSRNAGWLGSMNDKTSSIAWQ
ncbi:hypothetical protein [Streptosporangium sp. NPDC051022]|uniref:hypothetical protein n=1 Tax=Streptosporangium sp. NPDC051022 TaxID=3155752 RepID=UPI00341C0D99